MTDERMKHLAEQWAAGGVCTISDSEAKEYHRRVLELLRERDAAVSDLETIIAYGGGNLDTCQFCKNGQCYARGGTRLCYPEWRGVKEDGKANER